jgi:hypothetical protein
LEKQEKETHMMRPALMLLLALFTTTAHGADKQTEINPTEWVVYTERCLAGKLDLSMKVDYDLLMVVVEKKGGHNVYHVMFEPVSPKAKAMAKEMAACSKGAPKITATLIDETLTN